MLRSSGLIAAGTHNPEPGGVKFVRRPPSDCGLPASGEYSAARGDCISAVRCAKAGSAYMPALQSKSSPHTTNAASSGSACVEKPSARISGRIAAFMLSTEPVMW